MQDLKSPNILLTRDGASAKIADVVGSSLIGIHVYASRGGVLSATTDCQLNTLNVWAPFAMQGTESVPCLAVRVAGVAEHLDRTGRHTTGLAD